MAGIMPLLQERLCDSPNAQPPQPAGCNIRTTAPLGDVQFPERSPIAVLSLIAEGAVVAQKGWLYVSLKRVL